MVKTDGFLAYKPEHLRKVNAIRRVISAPDATLPPILNNGQIVFSSAKDAEDEPRSCYNCVFYNYDRSCQLMGQKLVVKKFIWPHQAMADSKRVEFWPVCSYWIHGEPTYGAEKTTATIDPDFAGLCWINAPEVGLAHSGSNCGGANDGDDCDFYMTPGADKRAFPTGFCRVLQRNVNNLDCCGAWLDDDLVGWRTAQERIRA